MIWTEKSHKTDFIYYNLCSILSNVFHGFNTGKFSRKITNKQKMDTKRKNILD